MAEIQCFHCNERWPLGTATTNRCPKCGWIVEIYYQQDEADAVAAIYNDQAPPPPEPSGVAPLIGINGFSVSFSDQDRLAQVAREILDREAS